MKILILCTGNSCRSQMAQGFMQSFDKRMQVFSAGTAPARKVNPMAVDVMKKAGIDISHNKPQNVDQYLAQEWDYVITVCDHANEVCPVFPGKVRKGNYTEVINEFYRIRNDIRDEFYSLYESEIMKKL